MDTGIRPLPKGARYQQTLLQSFTLGGIGLHTAEYAFVRVRPAFAGEGRYFVRVPKGTNGKRFELLDQNEEVDAESVTQDDNSQSIEALKIELWRDYMAAQENEDFRGTFQDFVHFVNASPMLQGDEKPQNVFDDVPEDIVPRSEDETSVSASLSELEVELQFATCLGSGKRTVMSVESLLAALEACGVDNARVEIEGGPEVPVLDGSCLGWTIMVQQAGLRAAPDRETGQQQPKMALRPKEFVHFQEDDSFVTFVPDYAMRVTAGVNHTRDCQLVGKQWMEWCVEEDNHFRLELAPARVFSPSPEWAYMLRDLGYFKAGTEGCMIIGHRDRWWNPEEVRFFDDEPVRRRICELIGDLALLAEGGNSGMPVGHVLAYNADHAIFQKFLEKLKESCTEADWEPVFDHLELLDVVEEKELEALDEQEAKGELEEEEEDDELAALAEGEEGEEDEEEDQLEFWREHWGDDVLDEMDKELDDDGEKRSPLAPRN